MTQTHCGMDFGTSNSTVAVAAGNRPPMLLPLEDGRPTIPSAVFYSFEDDRTYFGRQAIGEYVGGGDGRLLRSLKSVLGTALFGDTTRVKRQALAFSDILGMFLGELKRRAEAAQGGPLTQIVCGRPVQFVDDDPRADAEAQRQLESAVRALGYRHVEFQYEPIAAALDYEQRVTGEELALVADIGGGTSDFTVIRLSPERARAADRRPDLLATSGVHVGGTDFDRLLSLGRVMPLLGYRTETADGKRPLPSAPYYDLATWHRINRLYNAKALEELRSTQKEARFPELVARLVALVEDRQGHRLAGRVEEAKIALSDSPRTEFRFSTRDVALAAPIGIEDLNAALAGPTAAIAATIASTLVAAGIPADRVDTLILTGGSTRVPAVRDLLRRQLPGSRVVETDAFGSVGLGLALEATRRFG